MQRIAVGGLVVAAVAAAVWVTLGPGDEAHQSAPAVSSEADPVDRVVGPPLVFSRREPVAPEAPGADAPAGEPLAGEPEAQEPAHDPQSVVGEDPMRGSGGGSSSSRVATQGRSPIDGGDGPSAPADSLPPPSDRTDGSEGSDPGGPDPDLEARVAEIAREKGLVDPEVLDERARASGGDPNGTPAEQEAYKSEETKILTDAAILDHLIRQQHGPDVPPSKKNALMGFGETLLSSQSDAYIEQQMEAVAAQAAQP